MSDKRGKFHALLAVLPGLKGVQEKIMTETIGVFASKGHLFDSQVKTYRPMAEGADTLPEERTPLATTVGEKLAHLVEMVSPALDGIYQAERTNQRAMGTLKVGDKEIPNVPATFLMQLDKQLARLRNVIDAIPTRDPMYDWTEDVSSGKGVFRAKHDEVGNRTVEKIVPIVLAQATDKFPAQVKEGKDVVKVGEWTTKRWTGKLSPAQKYELLSRLDALQRAAKVALAESNEAEHDTGVIAEQMFGYLFAGVPMSR